MTMTTPTRARATRLRMAAGATSLALALTAGLAVATSAQEMAEPLSIGTATSDLGTFLTDANGMTLYYFTKDTVPGVSVCQDDCAVAWPPLTVAEGQAIVGGEGVTGVLAAAPRPDGTLGVTYDGRPLYLWQGDTEPGQTTGQGFNDVWYVALENGSLPADPAAPAPTMVLGVGTTEELGQFLTDPDGMTLYYFTKDTVPGVSVCQDDCAVAWPPLTIGEGETVGGAEGVTGVLAAAPRPDGTLGVTYDGRPLYLWQGDTEPGQTTGQGFNDVWYVAALDGSIPHEESME